jgi:threonine dehydrogenase-like Zn-dependent dehydrogenase
MTRPRRIRSSSRGTGRLAAATERARHTIEGNYVRILQWIADGRLVVDPLRTHVLGPDACQEAYAGLAHDKAAYVGVLFDWTRAAPVLDSADGAV